MVVSPVLRQLLVVVSSQLAAFSVGGAVTFPTLLMQQFRDNDTSIQLDLHTKSWIGSIYGLAGIPSILMPIVTQCIGRKYGYIVTCTFIIIGWILTYTAKNTTMLLVSESFHGLGTNSLTPVCFLGMAEMLNPKYRFASMQTYGLVQVIGMAICGVTGQFLHFKTVAIIMFIPIVAAVAAATVWVESPSWLAYRGKFEQCEQSFVKLRGQSDASNMELRELILAQKENLTRTKNEKLSLDRLLRIVASADFYKPIFHVFILLNMMYWSGCDVIYIYFMEMVIKSINDENVASKAGIVMYSLTIVGSIITNLLELRFKNKPILLTGTCGVIVFLMACFVTTVLQAMGVVAADSKLLMYCLTGFIVCTNLGLNGMVFIISAEIIPVKYKSISGSFYIILNCALYSSSLKLSPYLFEYLGLPGTFSIYILSTVICAWIVWKYVPETKGRTLQEIENFYNHGKFVETRVFNDLSVYPMQTT